ncbi:MAG: HEAT repeat domain-containing protein [Planctomycetota bacterium]
MKPFAMIAVGVALAGSASADVIRLGAGRIVGEAATPNARSGETLTVATPYGTVELPTGATLRVDRETPAAVEHRRRAPGVSDTAEAQFAFGLWCRANGLASESRARFTRVIELDPDHAEARRLLGYERVGDAWMTQEDKLVARGLVRWRGDYLTPQEVELLGAEQAEKDSSIEWRRRIDSIRARVASPDPEAARLAAEELEAVTDAGATPAILSWLDGEPSLGVRRGLLRALGRIATPAALDRLLAASLIDPDADTRAEARSVIASVRPSGMLDPFVAALGSNNNAVVNRAAVALAEFGADSLVGPLIDALVTTHRRVLTPGGDSQRYDINTASGRFSFGGGGPQVSTGPVRNPDVLSALVALTGQNFLYDQPTWRSWLAAQQETVVVDLRRDP